MYEESGSENDDVEENEKGENKKNTKELAYTNIGSYKRGEWPNNGKSKNPRMIMKSQEIKKKMKKLLSPRK